MLSVALQSQLLKHDVPGAGIIKERCRPAVREGRPAVREGGATSAGHIMQ